MNDMNHRSLLSSEKADALTNTEFFGDVIAELAGTLEDTVGLEDAKGYIAIVGENIGAQISDFYDTGAPVSTEYIGQILVDLKRQIGGEFSLLEVTEDKIVLTNTRCPFVERVHGKKSLCMMTTNVFGKITADRNGYAHVNVEASIAENQKKCHVVVTLNPEAVSTDAGIEFFG